MSAFWWFAGGYALNSWLNRHERRARKAMMKELRRIEREEERQRMAEANQRFVEKHPKLSTFFTWVFGIMILVSLPAVCSKKTEVAQSNANSSVTSKKEIPHSKKELNKYLMKRNDVTEIDFEKIRKEFGD